MLYNVMSLIGAGSWNGGMKNAQTYWGLTRKIGPYKPTKYDDELAHSREPAYGHTREEFFKPAPYIQTKPFPGLFNYDTHDVVAPPTQTVPSKRMGIVGRSQYPNSNGITGKPKMRNPYTTIGTMEDKYEGYYAGSSGDHIPIGHGERTPFYEQEIVNLNKGRGKVLGKRREFHFNDYHGQVNPDNAKGRKTHDFKKVQRKFNANVESKRDAFNFDQMEKRNQRYKRGQDGGFDRRPMNTTVDPRRLSKHRNEEVFHPAMHRHMQERVSHAADNLFTSAVEERLRRLRR